jgi:hypothetical protein
MALKSAKDLLVQPLFHDVTHPAGGAVDPKSPAQI